MSLTENHPDHRIRMEDGARLAVWDSGGPGTPVVLIHGFPENHHSWDHLLKVLNLKQQRYRFIRYDLRGFGQSSKTGEASLNRFFADHEQVIQSLKLKKYHLVGHDWGGAVGLHAARYSPGSLRTLTLLNTNYWKTDIFRMWHLWFLNLPIIAPLVFRLFPTQLFRAVIRSAFVQSDRMDRRVAGSFLEMFRDLETTRYWIRLYRSMAKILLVDALPMLRFLLNRGQTPRFKRARNAYRVKTALIWGEADPFNPLWIGEDMQTRLEQRGATVHWYPIPDAGHFVHEEQPEEVAKVLKDHWR